MIESAIIAFLLGGYLALLYRAVQHRRRLNRHQERLDAQATGLRQLNEGLGQIQAFVAHLEERNVERAERVSALAERVGFLEHPPKTAAATLTAERVAESLRQAHLEDQASKRRTIDLRCLPETTETEDGS